MRLFLAVARTGSISGGAKQLGVQHSTVSRRMRKLEEKLGARLIEHIKKVTKTLKLEKAQTKLPFKSRGWVFPFHPVSWVMLIHYWNVSVIRILIPIMILAYGFCYTRI